jgi:translocation and assembly module TamB
MTEPAPKPVRRLRRYLLLTFMAGVVLLAFTGWYMTTDSFQRFVRRRVVTELERVTGGRVELGSFHTIPFRLQIEVRNLTIHGLEPSASVPYVRVERAVARVRVFSLPGREVGADSLVLEHPVVHILVAPNGTTNVPEPGTGRPSGKTPVDGLFDVFIGHLEVNHGELLWNDDRTPLDFAASDVFVGMKRGLLRRHYAGTLRLGKVDTKLRDFRPFAWAAAVEFSLTPKRLEVTSLQWSSNRSRVNASGSIADFQHPQWDATYQITLDLADAAATARVPQVRGGTLELGGKGTYAAPGFSAIGKALVRDLQLQEGEARIRSAGLNANYKLDPRRLEVRDLQARLLGGIVNGDVEVTNWLESPVPAKGVKPASLPRQRGVVHLKLRDLSLAELSALASRSSFPVARLHPAGAVSGTVEAMWQGSPRQAEAEIALDVAAPGRPPLGSLPVNGRFHGTWRNAAGQLELAELKFSTLSTHFEASGTLGSDLSALKLAVNSNDLGEWQPLLESLRGWTPAPVHLHGQGTFNGSLRGEVPHWLLAGHLQLNEFDSVLTDKSGEKRAHWDSLACDVQVSPQLVAAHNGTLRRGPMQVNFDARAGLQNGNFVDTSAVSASLQMHDAQVEDLLTLAGYNYPLHGTAKLTLQLSGTKADPRGEGKVTLTDAIVYGEPITRFHSNLRLANGEVELEQALLLYQEGQVTGSAAYNLRSRTFRLDAAGQAFDLARLPWLRDSRLGVKGSLDFQARGQGTLDQPAIEARMDFRNLGLNGEPLGDFQLEATTRGAEMRVTGRSHFQRAELVLDGKVTLRDDWPADLELHFSQLDVDSLIQTYLHGSVTGHSAVEGSLQVRGSVRRPRDLNLVGDLNRLSAEIQNIKIRNQGPLRFHVTQHVLKLDPLHLVGDDTDLTGGGTIRLDGAHDLDLRADGRMSLVLLQSLNPDFTAAGNITVATRVGGTWEAPSLQGKVEVSGGTLLYANLPNGLSDINGTLVFNQDRLQVERLTARTGGGSLTLGGYLSYGRRVDFNLVIKGQEVRLRYPPGMNSTANADLRLYGTAASATLAGDVTVTKFGLAPGFDFSQYLARSRQIPSTVETSSLLNRLKLDVHVVSTPDLRMQTSLARISGDADLRLRGTAAHPALLGRTTIQEGEISFNGSKYRLERGDITFFPSGSGFRPILDLEASTHVRDYDIDIKFSGEADKPLHVNYSSEPPLPEADIIALLAMGRTREESAAVQSSQSAFTQEASSAILSQALNSTVSSRVQRLFGVSRIKIDPQASGTAANPGRGPQVTIEQQISNSLVITYSQDVAQATQQTIQGELNLTRNVSLVAIRDYNGVFSFDIRVRQRKK